MYMRACVETGVYQHTYMLYIYVLYDYIYIYIYKCHVIVIFCVPVDYLCTGNAINTFTCELIISLPTICLRIGSNTLRNKPL